MPRLKFSMINVKVDKNYEKWIKKKKKLNVKLKIHDYWVFC